MYYLEQFFFVINLGNFEIFDLSTSQENYNWTLDIEQTKLEEKIALRNYKRGVAPTKLWDQVQNDGCCGYYTEKEWNKYGKIYTKLDNVYPKSCCESANVKNMSINNNQHVYYCTKIPEYFNLLGCLNMLSFPLVVSICSYISVSAVSLLLAILSIIASLKSRKSHSDVNTEMLK